MRMNLDKLIPVNPEHRAALASLFVESMDYAHSVRPEWCVVKRDGRSIRLHAGRFIVFTIEQGRTWLATDPAVRVPADVSCWAWDTGRWSVYKRIPSKNGYFTPAGDWRPQWDVIAPAHFEYVYRVLNGPAPDHRTAGGHNAELAQMLCSAATIIDSPHRRAADSVDSIMQHRSEFDDRPRVTARRVVRPGQAQFRKRLMAAYDARCAITGCNVDIALEAAHIFPYNGPSTDIVSNGLLLRRDIHKLFDEHVLTVSASTMTVKLAPQLSATQYGELHGQRIYLPVRRTERPAEAQLRLHEKEFYETIKRLAEC